MALRDPCGRGVAHQAGDGERRDGAAGFSMHGELLLEGALTADTGSNHAGHSGWLIRWAIAPSGLLQSLGCGCERQLREAIGAASVLARKHRERIELAALPQSMAVAPLARDPAAHQCLRADAERGERSHSSDGCARPQQRPLGSAAPQSTTTDAQVKPEAKAASSVRDPARSLPCWAASASAIGIDAAEVLP